MFKQPFIKLMFIAGLVFGVFFGIGSGLTAVLQHNTAGHVQSSDQSEEEIEAQRINILLLGVDARPGEEHSRSDVMMLLCIDTEKDNVALISIPRDTRMDTSRYGVDKICGVNCVAGPSAAVKTVEDLLDSDIDYYVEMDFKGFKKIVDTLGGVTIEVPCRMYKPGEGINLQPGLQHLNGSQALGFVRYRDYTTADIQRTAMQQAFIKALAGEVLQPKTIPRIPQLVKEISQCVKTDMPLSEWMNLVAWLPKFDSENLVTQTLPGNFCDVRDSDGNLIASYWVVDEQAASGLVGKLFSGQTIAVVENHPITEIAEDPAGDGAEEKADGGESSLQRSELPSPGHNGEYEQDTPVTTGAEGYM